MVASAAGARADFKCVHLKKREKRKALMWDNLSVEAWEEVIYTSSLKCIQPGIIWSFFFRIFCVRVWFQWLLVLQVSAASCCSPFSALWRERRQSCFLYPSASLALSFNEYSSERRGGFFMMLCVHKSGTAACREQLGMLPRHILSRFYTRVSVH